MKILSKKKLWFVRVTEMEDLRVVGVLGIEDFEGEKKRYKTVSNL